MAWQGPWDKITQAKISLFTPQKEDLTPPKIGHICTVIIVQYGFASELFVTDFSMDDKCDNNLPQQSLFIHMEYVCIILWYPAVFPEFSDHRSRPLWNSCPKDTTEV